MSDSVSVQELLDDLWRNTFGLGRKRPQDVPDDVRIIFYNIAGCKREENLGEVISRFPCTEIWSYLVPPVSPKMVCKYLFIQREKILAHGTLEECAEQFAKHLLKLKLLGFDPPKVIHAKPRKKQGEDFPWRWLEGR